MMTVNSKTITKTVTSKTTAINIGETITSGDSGAYIIEITFSDVTSISGTVQLHFALGDGTYADRDSSDGVVLAGNKVTYTLEEVLYSVANLTMYVQFLDSNLYTPLKVSFSGIRVLPGGTPTASLVSYPAWVTAIASAEALRVIAESARVIAEGLRVTADGSRTTAEGLRVVAENGRVSAEQGRVTVEGNRVVAENARVVAEGDAVSGRVKAEADRVIAENARGTAIGTLANLTTTDKTNLVAAVNEVDAQLAQMTPTNIICLPPQYDLVVADSFELFSRGILRVNNPDTYCVVVLCDIGYAYGRKYFITPSVGDIGTHVLTVEVVDDTGRTIDTQTTNLVVRAKAAYTGRTAPDDDGTHNLIDATAFTMDTYIDDTTGIVEANAYTSTYCVSDYMNVVAGQTYALYNIHDAYSYAAYNASNGLVGYGRWFGLTKVMPTGATKLRVCFKDEDANLAELVVAKGSAGFTTYIDTYAEYVAVYDGMMYVLCVGDSLVADGEWVTELYRRLIGTGGTPTADALTNITFIGTEGTTPKYEGHGGYTYALYNSPSSPMYIGGVINWAAYATSLSAPQIDVVNVLMGWNSSGDTESASKTSVRLFINNVRASFPQCIINLFGIQVADVDGLANYNASWNWYDTLQYVMNYNEWLEEVAAEYSGVYFVQVSGQFDSDNNMQQSTRAVNLRNAATEVYGTNGLHPADSGYLQIGDAAYRVMQHTLPLFM